MADIEKSREIELIETYVADQRVHNPEMDHVVEEFLGDQAISEHVRDNIRAAIRTAKLEGVTLGMRHDDGQEVEVDGLPFPALLARGKSVETRIEVLSKSSMLGRRLQNDVDVTAETGPNLDPN